MKLLIMQFFPSSLSSNILLSTLFWNTLSPSVYSRMPQTVWEYCAVLPSYLNHIFSWSPDMLSYSNPVFFYLYVTASVV
jgi:hypothetical protein